MSKSIIFFISDFTLQQFEVCYRFYGVVTCSVVIESLLAKILPQVEIPVFARRLLEDV